MKTLNLSTLLRSLLVLAALIYSKRAKFGLMI
jgi:hypothetical protein